MLFLTCLIRKTEGGGLGMGLFVESGSEKYIKLCMRLFCFSLFVCKSKSEKKQEMTLVGILLGN
jgi:hypothetical protein